MSMKKNKYFTEKDIVRNDVIRQLDVLFYPGQSYTSLADTQEKLYKIAKKYGLIKEFKENGIL